MATALSICPILSNEVITLFSIIFALYSLRYLVNITFQGMAAQLSHGFHAIVHHVLSRYFILFDVHI